MDSITTITPTAAPLSWVGSSNASVEAMIRSNQIWAAGCKKLGEIVAETVNGHFTQTATALQAMGEVKTVKEAIELQSTYLRNTTEYSVAGARKLVDATNQMTHEVMSAKLDRLATVAPTSVAID